MPRAFREIQSDMDRALARLEQSHYPNERRSLLKELKRLLLECELLANASPLELHVPAMGTAGVVGEPDELALAIMEKLVRRNSYPSDHKP